MSTSAKKYLEQSEIDFENLSHYERFQLEKHGNILREITRHPVLHEMSNIEPEGIDNDFQNHIFSQINPAQ